MTKVSGILTKISDTEFTFTPNESLNYETYYRLVINSEFRNDRELFINHRTTILFETELEGD